MANSKTLVFTIALILGVASVYGQCPAVKKCLAGVKPCDVMEVPKRAMIVPPDPVELKWLRPSVYMYRDFAYMSLIIRYKKRVILIDAPDSSTGSNKDDGSRTMITDQIEKLMNGTTPTRIDIVYSHAHLDHIGASRRVVQWVRKTYPKWTKINIYGTSDVTALVRRSTTKRAVPPTKIIRPNKFYTLWVNKKLQIKLKVEGGHSGQDVQIFIPKSGKHGGILMHSDIVFPRWAPFNNVGVTEDFWKYKNVHNSILNKDFKWYIGGHVRMGDKNDVADNLRFIEDLLESAKTSEARVTPKQMNRIGFNNFFKPGTPQFLNAWFAAINGGYNVQAEVCQRDMIEKWGCKLGGVASSAFQNCVTAIYYVSLEY